MIYVGIDDTDIIDCPGTNKLAREITSLLRPAFACHLILRHQLLFDPRVPYTSKNSSCSMLFDIDPDDRDRLDQLAAELRRMLRERCPPGSDPGLCVTAHVPEAVRQFGRRCQFDLVRQDEARSLAVSSEIYLEGLGGTEDGVIGALASVGLAATADEGRVVQIGDRADDLSAWQNADVLRRAGVDEIRCHTTGRPITEGTIDVGKKLRPIYRRGKIVLYVTMADAMDTTGDVADVHQPAWQAVRVS